MYIEMSDARNGGRVFGYVGAEGESPCREPGCVPQFPEWCGRPMTKPEADAWLAGHRAMAAGGGRWRYRVIDRLPGEDGA